jgi:hypothetical protein
MTTDDDLAHLEAQRAVVEAQLERTPAEGRAMRINLVSRLQILDEAIAALEAAEALDGRARAVLTFGGKPVIEAGAIEASFSADALQAFQRLVSTTGATREGRKLGARGRIPDEEAYRLFITGTFSGSFGFQLEGLPTEATQERSVVRDAVDEASRLLLATRLDDEAYADAVADSNPRVVKALADFLGLMESRGATLQLSSGPRECHFDTPEAISAAAERARRTTITETEVEIRGVLSGVFAVGRRFEFKAAESGEILSGGITYDVTDPSSLKPYLWTRCIAHVWIVTVERAGKEQRRYYLTRVDPLTDEGEPPAS